MGEPARQDAVRQMRLRYAGTCRQCGARLSAGTVAEYDRATRTVACLDCERSGQGTHVKDLGSLPEPPQAAHQPGPAEAAHHPDLDHDVGAAGSAGRSARREHDQRKARREERIRTAHPRLGGLILAVTDEPQGTKAWAVGAAGEERLGSRLDALRSSSVAVLHDRRIRGTRANIDHIVITANGVFVVDAKKYVGRPTLKVEGGILRPRVERLMVGRRDSTALVDGVLKQVGLVQAALASVDPVLPVRGVLCFVDADWPLIGGSFKSRDVDVVWPKRLGKAITASAAGPTDRVSGAAAQHLMSVFPPA